jgi:hypothetical protein
LSGPLSERRKGFSGWVFEVDLFLSVAPESDYVSFAVLQVGGEAIVANRHFRSDNFSAVLLNHGGCLVNVLDIYRDDRGFDWLLSCRFFEGELYKVETRRWRGRFVISLLLFSAVVVTWFYAHACLAVLIQLQIHFGQCVCAPLDPHIHEIA